MNVHTAAARVDNRTSQPAASPSFMRQDRQGRHEESLSLEDRTGRNPMSTVLLEQLQICVLGSLLSRSNRLAARDRRVDDLEHFPHRCRTAETSFHGTTSV